MKEWDYSKNTEDPYYLSYNSKEKYWWTCSSCQESWQTSLQKRAIGRSCPYCTNKKVKAGVNDFKSKYPIIALEWDYDKNSIRPEEVLSGSNKKYWWICLRKHSWQASPNSRGAGNRNCRKCCFLKNKQQESLSRFLKNLNLEYIEGDRTIIAPYEIDFLIEKEKIAIEFNGEYWHSEKIISQKHNMSSIDYHEKKLKLCQEKEYSLIFVWEKDWMENQELVKQSLERVILHKEEVPLLFRRLNSTLD